MASTGIQLRLGLPKGRMQGEVTRLMEAAGLPVRIDERGYRPEVGPREASREDPGLAPGGAGLSRAFGLEAKLLKPQNILRMLDSGSRDLGFAGADWAAELSSRAVELLDTGLDPVRIVAAAPEALVKEGSLSQGRTYVVASEYEALARAWIASKGLEAGFIRSYGATEVFPPEDADVVVDNCASGSTLRANGLVVVDELMASSTRLYASRQAMADPARRQAAESFALLLGAVLEARRRVMIEVNVEAALLAGLTAVLPCLKAPTVSPLKDGQAFAVRVAAPRALLAALIPEIRRAGGTGIVVSEISQLLS